MARVLGSVASVAFVAAACGRTTEPEPIDSAPIDGAIAAACARVLACSAGTTHRSLSECVLVNSGPRREPDQERVVVGLNALGDMRSALRACINDARADCAKIRFCATGQSGPCAGIPEGGAICEGIRYVQCKEGVRTELDCTTNDCKRVLSCDLQPKGTTCLTIPDGRAGCGVSTCSEASFVKSCDGSGEVLCMAGIAKRYACSSGCGIGPDGKTGCLPLQEDRSCTVESRPHCEGNAKVRCSSGREWRESCDQFALPMTCVMNDPCGAAGPCVECVPSPRLRCDPRVHLDRCRGAALLYCDGQQRTVDCGGLGFRGCEETPQGARCVP